ncbi:hypothetical protein C2E23DRAFT_737197 [Lenzites betulinus]|nr:hypothetical protein C2E23DRAFT_737197 [Lenzites betulinus]
MDDLDGAGLNCVYDAPMAFDQALSRTAGLDPPFARARQRGLLGDCLQSIVGPVPVNLFIEKVVGTLHPDTDERMRMSATNAFRSVPPTADTPEQIFEPLLVALNKQTKHKSRCPGFVFVNTARRSTHPTRPGFAKPHICCLTRRNVEVVQRLDRHSRSELGYAELIIQATGNPTRDYFTDPPSGLHGEHRASFEFLNQWEDSQTQKEVADAFALHLAFVTEVFARQHRNAFYSISMTGSRARLLRWDRAGCLVSEAFDIREHPEDLCYFLWRFSRTNDKMRGHDTTVGPATLQQELQFRDVVREYVRSQLELEGEALDKAVSQHYCPGRAAVVAIYPHPFSRDNIWRFIISRPVVSPTFLVGRGTRGNWAVECTTSRLVFLKDTWHNASLDRTDTEGEILGYLNELEVRNIPALFTHGDVPDYVPKADEDQDRVGWQSTITGVVPNHFERCSVAGQLASVAYLQRYRIAVSTVGYGLSAIRGTEELLHATYDAFTAMRDTLSKASRIHRDISVGNIILVKVPGQEIRRGYLIDWETSDHIDDAGDSVHAGRAGTWYFMSVRMLSMVEVHKHTFLDDMESLIHVIIYCALLYLPHKLARGDLVDWIYSYFERIIHYAPPKPTHGGDAKFRNSRSLDLIKDTGFGSEALVEWLTTMLRLQRPRLVEGYDCGEQWNPEDVGAFWSEFLRSRSLERDNRSVHDVTKEEDREFDLDELSVTPPSIPPTIGKRPIRDRNLEMSSSKRRRTLRSGEIPRQLSEGIVSSRIIDGRRRSERIRTIQDRSQPAQLVASHTPRASQSSTAAVGRPGKGRGRGLRAAPR